MHRLMGPTPGVSDLGGLGWGLRFCIFNELPADEEVTGLRPHG